MGNNENGEEEENSNSNKIDLNREIEVKKWKLIKNRICNGNFETFHFLSIFFSFYFDS
jgi:hypothetical protein